MAEFLSRDNAAQVAPLVGLAQESPLETFDGLLEKAKHSNMQYAPCQRGRWIVSIDPHISTYQIQF